MRIVPPPVSSAASAVSVPQPARPAASVVKVRAAARRRQPRGGVMDLSSLGGWAAGTGPPGIGGGGGAGDGAASAAAAPGEEPALDRAQTAVDQQAGEADRKQPEDHDV